MLAMLNFSSGPFEGDGRGSSAALHLQVEAMRRAFADRQSFWAIRISSRCRLPA
jgi:gamma-glutamyltranspeptidase